jgi:hypothetical protein
MESLVMRDCFFVSLTERLVAAVKDEPFERARDAFYEFCVYLDTEKGFGDGEFARAFSAALERRAKDYSTGCAILGATARR